MSVQATGAAGSAPGGTGLVASGLGDAVSGTLSGLTGGTSTLDVCVDQGGGNAALSALGVAGGGGGGASGVSVGSDFSSPVVVAGGGGGGGEDANGAVAAGGNAGEPVASSGSNDPSDASVTGGGGGNNTSGSGGAAGTGAYFGAASAGAGFTAAGPGAGGSEFAAGKVGNGPAIGGGAGGGGYYGGGAGGLTLFSAAGGGGGGSDYCVDGASVSGCSVSSRGGTQTVAGTAAGDAQVTLTYTALAPPTVTITTPPNGATTYTYGQVVGANYSCAAGVGGTLESCVGTVADGSAINTLTVGSGQSFTVTATDTDGQSKSVTNTYSVVAASTSLKAAPQLVLFEPFVGVGNQVVQATLTSGGSPVAGQTISFSVGSTHLCSAVTSSRGVARCTISSFDQALVNRNNRSTATFTATTDYTGSSSTVPAITFFY